MTQQHPYVSFPTWPTTLTAGRQPWHLTTHHNTMSIEKSVERTNIEKPQLCTPFSETSPTSSVNDTLDSSDINKLIGETILILNYLNLLKSKIFLQITL